MRYINIHRHGKTTLETEWGVENIYKDFLPKRNSPFSAGLHPWFLQKDWPEQMELLAQIAKAEHCIAIGECGLDRICQTDFALQKEVFIAQIKLANQLLKPIILHCVRAHEDCMQILVQEKNKMPVIFHGYNKGYALAQKIMAQGHYLSFGKDLQRLHLQQIFAKLPLEFIFLETDDATIDIKEIYTTAAACHNISAEELSLQLQQNLRKVFNILI